jgi:hypothetical protein
MSSIPYIEIPTYEGGNWTTTLFQTRDDFKTFVLSLFKEPGKYEFDDTSHVFNSEARKFRTNKLYCAAPSGSKDFIHYWDGEKLKCRRGAIFRNGDKLWYITRDYYMWLNFLPINDKEQKKFDFPQVRDVQYHLALYELLAELHYQHCAILKKRQIASSYFHAAKLINQLWFEETPILKIGASLKDYINEKGTWKFLNEYRSFLNEHTAWYRPFNPGGMFMWQQQIEASLPGSNRKVMKGLKGTLQGVTFEKDATSGVGGPCTIFFHEEAGIAPKMDETVEYLFPALQSGDITTGMFIAAGSVGDLDQCQPLKKMIDKPEVNSIYPVYTNLIDDKGTWGYSGLFIPEQWSMPPYIDEFGNSNVEQALEALNEKFEKWKKDLSPEKYQLRISQHPRNIAEAFAYRSVSKFPLHLVKAQLKRIEDKDYAYEFLDISRNAEGKVIVEASNRLPIKEFPVKMDAEDKSAVLVVYERPVANPEFGMYYASIDPVSEGKTTTSDSLCSIIVYKNPVEVTKINGTEVSTHIERDKIVATWCGRFEDINKTHERLEMIVEWYNAWTIVENNVSLFIQHMINRKKQRYLVPKSQILFLKDIGSNQNVYQEYGWRNTGTLFRSHLLSYAIEFLKEELDQVVKEDGTIVKTIYGVERVPDDMILQEMLQYQDDLNVDRLVSFSALVAFAKIQQSNRGYKKIVERVDNKHLQKSENLYKLSNSPFRHIGKGVIGNNPAQIVKRPFKNIR